MTEKDISGDPLERLHALINQHELDCIECRQPFRDPRMLHCGHVFCYDCIDTRISTYGNDTGFSCPKCNVVHCVPVDGTSLIRKAIFVSALLEAKNILQDGVAIRCTSCDRNRASHACMTCSAFLCKSCNDKHAHNQSDGLQHETDSLLNVQKPENFIQFQQRRYRPCAFHPNKKSTLFCKYDERRVCEECANDDSHKDHSVTGLREKLDLDIADLQKKVKEAEGL